MLRFVLIAFFLITFSFADILKLNKNEIDYIKTLPDNKVIAKRFSNFYKFLNEAKSYDLSKKLLRTNLHINRILPRPEPTNNWSSPKMFFINGYGDCEDYVLAKYFSLLHLGIDKKDFYLSVVKVKGAYGHHMVLIYKNKDEELMVLDNLSWKIVPLKDRTDLKFKYAFNEYGSFTIENNSLKKETNIVRTEVEDFRNFIAAN